MAFKVIPASKPLSAAVVIVEVPDLPLATVIAVGEALMVKVGLPDDDGVTVKVTAVVWVMPPPIPVTVIV